MDRRGFLTLSAKAAAALGMAATVGAAPLLVDPYPGAEFWIEGFDYDNSLGVAMRYQGRRHFAECLRYRGVVSREDAEAGLKRALWQAYGPHHQTVRSLKLARVEPAGKALDS